MDKQTRRHVLSGLGAITLAATVPALANATVNPDAALLELGAAFEAAWANEPKAHADYEAGLISGEGCDEAYFVTMRIVHQIEKISAKTLQGLRVKARAVDWCFGDDTIEADIKSSQHTTDIRLSLSIIHDLLKGAL